MVIGEEIDRALIVVQRQVNRSAQLLLVDGLLGVDHNCNELLLEKFVTQIDTELLQGVDLKWCESAFEWRSNGVQMGFKWGSNGVQMGFKWHLAG
jgi:hypothetical protein